MIAQAYAPLLLFAAVLLAWVWRVLLMRSEMSERRWWAAATASGHTRLERLASDLAPHAELVDMAATEHAGRRAVTAALAALTARVDAHIDVARLAAAAGEQDAACLTLLVRVRRHARWAIRRGSRRADAQIVLREIAAVLRAVRADRPSSRGST